MDAGYEREGRGPRLRSETLRLVRSAREGVRMERGGGLVVRLAAPERDAVVERARVSMLGLLLAWVASGGERRA
jgi:hypothetical protein